MRSMGRRGRIVGALLALLLAAAPGLVAAQDLAVRAGTVHTVSGETIEDGTVLVREGEIVAVGAAARVDVPDGVDLLRFPDGVMTPGLINGHSTVGLAGIYNFEDQDLAESVGTNHADLRALDAFNHDEALVEWVRDLGTTTVHAVPGGAGPLIAGQSAVFKTAGDSADEMVVKAPAALVFQLGSGPRTSEYPGTRMGLAAEIRKALVDTRRYRERREREAADDGEGSPDGRDLKLEALGLAVAGEIPSIFVARREDDILTALRIADEFGLDLILDGATEAYLVADEIAAAGVPVIVGPVLEPPGNPDAINVSLENAALLANRGVTVALQSGFSPYVPKTRVLVFEAAMAMVNGLGFDRTLRAVTLDAARILGIDDRVGSLEPGKDGDLVVFAGDPFEYTTRVEVVVSEGRIVHRRSR